MSDEEQSFEEGLTGEADLTTQGKTGFLPSIVLKILKWAALIVAAVIFIVTVVVVTMKVMERGRESQSAIPVSEAYREGPPFLAWYGAIDEIRGRTSDENPNTVVVKVSIGYDQGNKAVQSELIQRTPRIRDMIRSYFSSKTARELEPRYEEEIKQELKERINRIMTQGKIREVIFLEFNVIPF